LSTVTLKGQVRARAEERNLFAVNGLVVNKVVLVTSQLTCSSTVCSVQKSLWERVDGGLLGEGECISVISVGVGNSECQRKRDSPSKIGVRSIAHGVDVTICLVGGSKGGDESIRDRSSSSTQSSIREVQTSLGTNVKLTDWSTVAELVQVGNVVDFQSKVNRQLRLDSGNIGNAVCSQRNREQVLCNNQIVGKEEVETEVED